MIVDPKLRSDFAEVIQYSQSIEEPKIEGLLRQWYMAKLPFMRKFLKNKTILRLPEKLTFTLNDEAKAQRFETFVEYVANLLEQMGSWDHPLVRYLNSISVQEFYGNSLNNDYFLPNTKRIQRGTKVVKSFKYFIFEEKLLHDIQSKASEIIQENKVEGYLTFSVHPLDFLSLSENCFHWRSCHSLDGDYRAGNLSYMRDGATIICYLQSEEEVKLPHFPDSVPWNNKKWRMLLHFNTEMNVVFAGRQYPFTSPGALEVVRKAMVDNLFPKTPLSIWHSDTDCWSHWHNDYIQDYVYKEFGEDDICDIPEETYAVIAHGIWNMNKIIHDAPNSKHFNDLTRSTCYTKPYYMFEKHHIITDLQFEIGKEIYCLRCGEKIIDGYDSMMCSDCECKYGNSQSEEYRSCDCCGTRFFDPRGHWIDDDFVCHSCFETQCFECEECGETFYNTDKHWDEETAQFLCNNCYSERME